MVILGVAQYCTYIANPVIMAKERLNWEKVLMLFSNHVFEPVPDADTVDAMNQAERNY